MEDGLAGQVHELAPHHLPGFLPAADGSDPMMTFTAVFLIAGVVLVGIFYLNLHSLPERMAHKEGRVQFELVAILCLLALFTHNQIFWVAALLLAFVTIPDVMTPLNTIASSLDRLARGPGAEPPIDPEPTLDTPVPTGDPAGGLPETTAAASSNQKAV
ncbi:hypothetical protein KHP62_13400 [Rhodobacteraceae bacterium NNCM2]|nr:hypothetical protein [Coraliihabitans acroporae]